MDQKVLLLFVVLALVGIAYYVRFKPHRAQSTTTTAETAQKPAKSTRCADNCLRIRVKCTANCGMDRPCLNGCDHARESCEAACP